MREKDGGALSDKYSTKDFTVMTFEARHGQPAVHYNRESDPPRVHVQLSLKSKACPFLICPDSLEDLETPSHVCVFLLHWNWAKSRDLALSCILNSVYRADHNVLMALWCWGIICLSPRLSLQSYEGTDDKLERNITYYEFIVYQAVCCDAPLHLKQLVGPLGIHILQIKPMKSSSTLALKLTFGSASRSPNHNIHLPLVNEDTRLKRVVDIPQVPKLDQESPHLLTTHFW